MIKKLVDLAEVQYGYAFDSTMFTEDKTYIELARIRDVKRGFSETYYLGEYSEKYVIHKNDLLIGMDGEFNIAKWKSNRALLNQRVCKITAKGDTDQEYLRYALIKLLKDIELKTAFVTVKHLSARELNKAVLNVPEYQKQKRISKILNKIDNIILMKKSEIENLDILIKARFVEMFGDPLLNPMEWEMKAIGEIATDIRYGTSKPAVENGQFPYLRMNNLTLNGELDISDLKYINVSEEELEKCVVKKGDILFNRTNSIDLIGKTAMFNLDTDMVIAGYIIRVRLNDELMPEILAQYMNLEAIKARLKGIARGAVNQANINAQELKSIKVYIPDMNTQKKFIEIKKQIDKSKVAIQKSLDETQLLFDSLMQKYFG